MRREKITLTSAIYFSFPVSAQNIHDIFGFWVKFDARDGSDVESIRLNVPYISIHRKYLAEFGEIH